MRPLTSSEQRLVLVFGILLFVVFNLVLVRLFWQGWQSAGKRLQQARQQRTVVEGWRRDQPFWTQRLEWITAHQPVYSGESTSRLLETVEAAAASSGVRIEARELLEPEAVEDLMFARVRVQAGGDLRAHAAFLRAVHDPQRFQSALIFSFQHGGAGDGGLKAFFVIEQACRPGEDKP